MKTLIVIDLQNDFIPGGALSVPGGDKTVSVINKIQPHFDLIVASQDWHPKEHVSFASNHPGKSLFDEITLHGQPQTLWPNHCVQGSKGAEFHSDLETDGWEAIFRKGTDPSIDSYSAFFDNGHLKSTGLTGYLKEKQAKHLYFCGLAADICVYYSIKDALAEDFQCFLIEDAAKALDLKKFEEMKKELFENGVKILSSEEFLKTNKF